MLTVHSPHDLFNDTVAAETVGRYSRTTAWLTSDFSPVLPLPPSVSSHRCSMFTQAICGGWTKGALEAAVTQGHSVTPSNNTYTHIPSVIIWSLTNKLRAGEAVSQYSVWLRTGRPWFKPRQERRISLLASASRPALGPTSLLYRGYGGQNAAGAWCSPLNNPPTAVDKNE
jgi:hypothetical protein